MKVKKLIETYLLACESRGLSKYTIISKRSALSALARWKPEPGQPFGDHDAAAVDDTMLARYIVYLRGRDTRWGDHPFQKMHRSGPLKESSVRAKSGNVKALFRWAVKQGLVEKAPVSMLPSSKYRRSEELKTLTPEEAQTLIAAADRKGPREAALIRLLLDSGARIGEVEGLTIANLDLVARRAQIVGKGEKVRFIFFLERTSEALAMWLASERREYLARKFPGDSSFVFLGKCGQLGRGGLRQAVYRLARNVGMKTHPHQCRHFFVCEALASGGDLGVLSQIVGHSGVAVTLDVYGHLSTLNLQNAHDRLSPMRSLTRKEL